jgi:glycerol-3-phosphate dehydrogenase
VVNASGVYVDHVCQLVDMNIARKMGGTKGSHILIPKFHGGPRNALYIEAVQDGRPFFIVPWRDYYLIGTTDIYYDGDLDEITASESEVNYLLHELNHFIPGKKFTTADVLYTYSGVRPLLYEPGKSESQVTRKHIIYDHSEHDGNYNLISVIGGKLTTYRSLAEECVDLICKKLGDKTMSETRHYPLYGSYGIVNIDRYIQDVAVEYARSYQLPLRTVEYLIRFYGSKFKNVLALTESERSLKKPICDNNPDIRAQIVYAIKFELAMTLDDILVSRTGIGTSACLGLDCVDVAAKIASRALGWNRRQVQQQKSMYVRQINTMYRAGLTEQHPIRKEKLRAAPV